MEIFRGTDYFLDSMLTAVHRFEEDASKVARVLIHAAI